MKKFELPNLEVEKLDVLDIITNSGCDSDGTNCPDDLGLG